MVDSKSMGRKATKEYGFEGFAGCVTQSRSRVTGTLVGLYHSEQAGIESDPATPWAVVCEKHATCVCVETLSVGYATLPNPCNFCDQCREEFPNVPG